VRVVAAGDALLSPSITRRVIAQFARLAPLGGSDALAGLTDRERQVLRLIARGLSNAEIAAEQATTPMTVTKRGAVIYARK
jgi:DNA-binding NarL/FixJ family response regulator